MRITRKLAATGVVTATLLGGLMPITEASAMTVKCTKESHFTVPVPKNGDPLWYNIKACVYNYTSKTRSVEIIGRFDPYRKNGLVTTAGYPQKVVLGAYIYPSIGKSKLVECNVTKAVQKQLKYKYGGWSDYSCAVAIPKKAGVKYFGRGFVFHDVDKDGKGGYRHWTANTPTMS